MPEIRRSQDGRPYIATPEGEEKLYSRSSKLASLLEDNYGLDLWHQRMVAVGVTDNQWLLREIDAARDEPKELNALCEIARDKAGASEGSAWGTIIHWFTECLDNGEDWEILDPPEDVKISCKILGKNIEEVYEEAELDLIAYEHATQDLKTVLNEQFVVCDEVKSAGTLDRVSFYRTVQDNLVSDLKTGGIDLNGLKFCMQLAIYAHSEMYVWDEGSQRWARQPLPYVNRERALVIHLPRGKGECTLYWADIAKGWEAVQFGLQLKEMRNKSKKWLRDVSLPDPVPVPPLPNGGEGMKVAELRDFARTWKIPLEGKTKKAEILEIVKSAEGLLLE